MTDPGPSPDLPPDDPVMDAVARETRTVASAARRRGDRLGLDPDDLAVVDRGLDEGWWGRDRRRVVTAVGCFVGEVLRGHLEAVWAWDPDDGLHLRVGGRHVDPFAWVRRRLAGGRPIAARAAELMERGGDGLASAG